MPTHRVITVIGGILIVTIGFTTIGLYYTTTQSLTVATWQGSDLSPVPFMVQKSLFRKAQITISGTHHFYYHAHIQHKCRPGRSFESFVDLEILSESGIRVWMGTLCFVSS